MENRLEMVKRSLRAAGRAADARRHGGDRGLRHRGPCGARPHQRQTTRDTILNAIYRLHTEGSTNAEAGLRLGYQMAMQAYRPGAINRVILCSDGVANVGKTGAGCHPGDCPRLRHRGHLPDHVGFGMGNFNDVLMEQLADNGNGNYAYVERHRRGRRAVRRRPDLHAAGDRQGCQGAGGFQPGCGRSLPPDRL